MAVRDMRVRDYEEGVRERVDSVEKHQGVLCSNRWRIWEVRLQSPTQIRSRRVKASKDSGASISAVL